MGQLDGQRLVRPAEIVFVRGTGRCGSKTLLGALGAHPRLARVTVSELLPEALLDWNDEFVRSRVARTGGAPLLAAARGYFEAYCDALRESSGIPVHKATGQAHRLDDLLNLWPRARLVYLVRHPLEVVRSMVSADVTRVKGAYGYDATVANATLRWATDVATFLESAAARDPRTRVVRFEDMVGEGAPDFFAALFEFIGVEAGVVPDLGAAEARGDEFVLDRRERAWIIDATAGLVEGLGYDPDARSATVPAEHAGRVHAHAERRLAGKPAAVDGVKLVAIAVERARAAGHRRIGLLGAGYLLRLVGRRRPGLAGSVAAILDENPALAGARLPGLEARPVMPLARVAELGLDAVIPVSLVHQRALIRRCRAAAGESTRVVALWDEPGTVPALAAL